MSPLTHTHPIAESVAECLEILRTTLAESHGPDSTPMRALAKVAKTAHDKTRFQRGFELACASDGMTPEVFLDQVDRLLGNDEDQEVEG